MRNITSKNNEVALIHNVNNSYFREMMIRRGYKVFSAYKKKNIFLRQLRKKHLSSKLPFVNMWFKIDLNELDKYQNIIIFDATLSHRFVEYINNKFPNKRLIFWYWNPVHKSINPNLLRNICELWTYSLYDSKKYNLNYNTTFYFSDMSSKISQKNDYENYDIYFIGRDKGRYKKLINLKGKFNKLNLKSKFHIVPDKKILIFKKRNYKKAISYSKILDNISESKSILDITNKSKDGLTLRAMESIFFKKKLITNNYNIDKYDFYNSNNIFILGKDNIEELPDFLNSDYNALDDIIIDKYDFNNWIKRFNLSKKD